MSSCEVNRSRTDVAEAKESTRLACITWVREYSTVISSFHRKLTVLEKAMTTSTSTTRITAAAPQTHHYIRFSISPPLDSTDADALQIRRVLQTALSQSFGASLSHLYLDVLWLAPSGAECVVRTG